MQISLLRKKPLSISASQSIHQERISPWRLLHLITWWVDTRLDAWLAFDRCSNLTQRSSSTKDDWLIPCSLSTAWEFSIEIDVQHCWFALDIDEGPVLFSSRERERAANESARSYALIVVSSAYACPKNERTRRVHRNKSCSENQSPTMARTRLHCAACGKCIERPVSVIDVFREEISERLARNRRTSLLKRLICLIRTILPLSLHDATAAVVVVDVERKFSVSSMLCFQLDRWWIIEAKREREREKEEARPLLLKSVSLDVQRENRRFERDAQTLTRERKMIIWSVEKISMKCRSQAMSALENMCW